MESLTALFGMGGESLPDVSVYEFIWAITLAFLLTLVIAAVYQRTHRDSAYTQDYIHTLVILGTVVTVVVLGIGDNLAAAFGVFAAFSIIRFRRALPEARDVGYVFLAMAIGLACGSRNYDLAIIATLLVCAMILLLSGLDLFAPTRPTHQLRVRVTNEIDYDAAFQEPFESLVDSVHLLSVESVQAGMMTELRYSVRLAEDVSARELVASLQERNGNNRVLLTTLYAAEGAS